LQAKIPEWIQQAELALGRFIRLVDGEQTITGTFPAGVSTFTLPAGLKQLIHIQIGIPPDIKNLEIVSFPGLNTVMNNDVGSNPRAVAFVGRVAHLAPAPGTNVNYTMIYYGKPAPLSWENPTNDLMQMGADVLKYQALIYSAPYLGEDERVNTWNTIVSGDRVTLKKEYWNTHVGGGPLRIRNDVVGGDSHNIGIN